MRLLEHEGMALFRNYRIPTPVGLLATTVDEVVQFYETNGPTIIKAQVPFGKRAEAGLVRIAKTKADAKKFAKEILGSVYRGVVVEKVWVSVPLEAEEEFYVGITYEDRPVVLFGPGGAKVESQAIRKYELGDKLPPTPFPQEILQQLWTLFQREDAILAEINPLVRTKHGYFAQDAKITIDDYALYRHGFRPASNIADKTEADALAAGFQYLALEGDVGVAANGAGLAMHTLECLDNRGLRPADFLDIGREPAPEKVGAAVKLLASSPQVKKIIINIFADTAKCDEVAQAILSAGCKLPLFVRIRGANDAKGIKMLQDAGISADTDFSKLLAVLAPEMPKPAPAAAKPAADEPKKKSVPKAKGKGKAKAAPKGKAKGKNKAKGKPKQASRAGAKR